MLDVHHLHVSGMGGLDFYFHEKGCCVSRLYVGRVSCMRMFPLLAIAIVLLFGGR